MTKREYLDSLDNIEYAKRLAEQLELIMAIRENVRSLNGKEATRKKRFELCAKDIYKWLESER